MIGPDLSSNRQSDRSETFLRKASKCWC